MKKFVLLVLMLTLAQGCRGRSGYPVIGEFVDAVTLPTPSQAVRDAFNLYDPDRRRTAIILLAESDFGGEEQYVRVYRLMLGPPPARPDSDATVRVAAIRALAVHGSPEDVPSLAARLNDDAPMVVWTAAKALQRLHNPDEAVGPLVELLTQRESLDPDIKMAAADALGQYPQPLVFDTLVGLLRDRNFGVVAVARRSLVTLTGQTNLDEDPRSWLSWSRQQQGDLFAGQLAYTYTPFERPPGLLDKAEFWNAYPLPEPQTPRGFRLANEAEPDDDAG